VSSRTASTCGTRRGSTRSSKEGHYALFNEEFWAFFLGVLGLAIISASLSYFIVEKPALRLKNSIAWWRRTRRPPPETPDPSETAAVAVLG
jgi:peptidoglycan/LPS O-acetylase OafA/YrhL